MAKDSLGVFSDSREKEKMLNLVDFLIKEITNFWNKFCKKSVWINLINSHIKDI